MGKTGSWGDRWTATPDFPVGLLPAVVAKQAKEHKDCITSKTQCNNTGSEEYLTLHSEIWNTASEWLFGNEQQNIIYIV